MGMVSEFKEFAMRGNVIDLAVGVVIGGAFGKIVTSLVNDVIMPVIGKLSGGVNFSSLQVILTPATIGPDGKEVAAVALRYGAFLQSMLDFVLVAFAVFVFVKLVNKLHRRQEAAPAPPPEPSPEVVLLTEIRDALRASPR